MDKDAVARLSKKGGYVLFEIEQGSLERSANGVSYFKVYKGGNVTIKPKKENPKPEEVNTSDLPF